LREGLDDEKSGRASIKISINGRTVYNKVNPFAEDDWTKIKIRIPAKVLKKGDNTLEIINTTKDNPDEVVEERPDGQAGRDYSWGWMMIAQMKLLK